MQSTVDSIYHLTSEPQLNWLYRGHIWKRGPLCSRQWTYLPMLLLEISTSGPNLINGSIISIWLCEAEQPVPNDQTYAHIRPHDGNILREISLLYMLGVLLSRKITNISVNFHDMIWHGVAFDYQLLYLVKRRLLTHVFTFSSTLTHPHIKHSYCADTRWRKPLVSWAEWGPTSAAHWHRWGTHRVSLEGVPPSTRYTY